MIINQTRKAQDLRHWAVDYYQSLGWINLEKNLDITRFLLVTLAITPLEDLRFLLSADKRKALQRWRQDDTPLPTTLYNQRRGEDRVHGIFGPITRPGSSPSEYTLHPCLSAIDGWLYHQTHETTARDATVVRSYLRDLISDSHNSEITRWESCLTQMLDGRASVPGDLDLILGETYQTLFPQYNLAPAETLLL